MKTKDLSFLEAVEALKDGRCESIISTTNNCRYKINRNGELQYLDSNLDFSKTYLHTTVILGCWDLFNLRPQIEQRTFQYWVVIWKDSKQSPVIYYHKPDPSVYQRAQEVNPVDYYYTYVYPE